MGSPVFTSLLVVIKGSKIISGGFKSNESPGPLSRYVNFITLGLSSIVHLIKISRLLVDKENASIELIIRLLNILSKSISKL